MKIDEILTISDWSTVADLLKKNLSRFDEGDIERAIAFFENEHPIKKDSDRQDIYVKELVMGEDGKVKEENMKVRKSRMCIPYQQQIVNTACAFIFGNKIDLLLASGREDEANQKRFDRFQTLWNEELRMMTILRKMFKSTAVQTRSAINFFLSDNDKKEIRVKLYDYKSGYNIFRHKDDDDKLDAIVVEYKRDEIVDGNLFRDVSIREIYTAKNKYTFKNELLFETTKAPIDKITWIIAEQEFPEFEFVKDLINNQDRARSQHSDVNIRIGNPAIIVNGSLKTKPKYNDDVKIYEVEPSKSLDKSQKGGSATMQYLELTSAPESVKLELEMNERDIYRFTWEDLSRLLSEGKLSNLSTQSIRLMFTQCFVKLTEKQEIYDDLISRMFSILKKMLSITENDNGYMDLDVKFNYNSLLPDSVSDMIKMLAQAVEAGITSEERAVSLLPINTPETLSEIKKEKEANKNVVKPVNQTTIVDKNPPMNPDGTNGQ